MHTNVTRLVVSFGDCDPARLIYYPNYFDWFDRGAWQLFESVGLSWEVLSCEYEIAGMPLVEARAKFLAPLRWRDAIAIESRVETWSRATFEVSHRIFKNGTLCVDGGETRVWARRHPDDPERLRSASIPDEVKLRFETDNGG